MNDTRNKTCNMLKAVTCCYVAENLEYYVKKLNNVLNFAFDMLLLRNFL